MNSFTYSHLGQGEGMLSERVYSLLQSDDGALWWSTKKGVERYNGVSIRHYAMGNLGLFSNNAGLITKLSMSADSLLMAFDNKGGIFVYDEVQDMFRAFVDLTQQFHGDVILNDILPTREGMWLAMREGVFFAHGQKLVPVVRNVYVNTIVPTGDHLLFCTRNGVLGYALKNGGVPSADMKLPTLLTYNVESGYYDHIYNKVWLGGFLNGLRIFTPGEDGTLVEHGLLVKDISNPVRSITPYNDETMLVGIDGMGVYKVRRQPSASGMYEGELLFDANEGKEGVLHGNGVYAVMRDSWENIIIGTYSGGIDIARPVGSTPALFQHIRDNQQSLQNDHVNCVAQLPDGMLVMGTDNGVSLHNPLTRQWVHACQGAVVLSLCVTPDATLLAATYGKGVYEIRENGASRQLYTKKDGVLKDDHVYKLFYDRDGSLWMGCLDGELVKKGREGTVHYYPINNVQDITQLPDGKIAVGTANGIRLIDPETDAVGELDYSVANPDDINKYIHTLFVNDNDELWIGTDGGGVYIYDLKKNTCRQLTTADGLPSNTVSSIDKDCKGRMLIATDWGLSFVAQNDQVVDVNYCYGIEREYSARAVVNMRNNHVLYGTSTGALIINPDNIQKINYEARLNILGVSCTDDDSELFNERIHSMLKEKKLRLHYTQRTFDLFFESINLRNQFDIVYQYKVGEGEWSTPSDLQYIRFTNLEAGTHRLLLRSVSRTCGAVLDEVELTIIVAEPWWNSWWMWVVYISLVVLAFFGAWRVYQLHTKYMRLVVSSLEAPEMSAIPEVLEILDNPENPEAPAIPEAPESPENPEASPIPVVPETPDNQEILDAPDAIESSEFIGKVTKMVVEHLSDSDFNIDRLCREMAMSRTLFYIKLKSYTGKSPQDFIRVIRLERAAALLRSGHSVTETATLAGFDNAKYFSTVFKKYFGLSPSKYC